jgi:hypothetical protein
MFANRYHKYKAHNGNTRKENICIHNGKMNMMCETEIFGINAICKK